MTENYNHIEPPHDDPRYHLTEDLADKALTWLDDHQAFTPDKNTNTGAQKWVTHREKNQATVVCSVSSSGNSGKEVKSRTWSNAIRIMTIPRKSSISMIRLLVAAVNNSLLIFEVKKRYRLAPFSHSEQIVIFV